MTRKSELREKIDTLQGQVNQLLETNSTLESWRASWLNQFDDEKGSLQSVFGAWTQLLKMLEVDNQTMAVYRIEALLKNVDADKAILAMSQAKAAAEHNVSIHKLAIRQLEFQRDSAQKNDFDTGFELANVKARVGELEELLRDAIPAVNSDASQETIAALMVRINAMIGDY